MGMAYVADGVDLLGALDRDIERESLDSATLTLKKFVVVEHLLKLRVGLANVTEVVIPLVNGGVGQPDSVVAGLVLSGSATDDGLVLERNGVGPTSFLDAREILRLLLLAGGSRVGGDLGCTCVRHDASGGSGSGSWKCWLSEGS
jgi:hypothetical protein